MPPRTIDNLGPDASERYANDQRLTDTSFTKGIRPSPSQTEIDVSAPFFPGELDTLLGTQSTHSIWALFNPPPLYQEQRKRLFTFQLAPFMGPDEKWEAHTQKILEQLLPAGERDAKQGKDEKDEKEEEEEREKKILVKLLKTIERLNRLLIEIYGKKSQYHKG